jgi:hypothetical protein
MTNAGLTYGCICDSAGGEDARHTAMTTETESRGAQSASTAARRRRACRAVSCCSLPSACLYMMMSSASSSFRSVKNGTTATSGSSTRIARMRSTNGMPTET